MILHDSNFLIYDVFCHFLVMLKIIARTNPDKNSYYENSDFLAQIHVFTVKRKRENVLAIINFSKT